MPIDSSTGIHAAAGLGHAQADRARANARGFPAFDTPVAADGYRWWYIDGISDDGVHAITLIAFVGSVFSPWYARARRRGRTPAEAHCALNVALYSPGQARWTMTERHGSRIERSNRHFRIGPSELRWHDGALVFDIRERSAPWLQSVRGRVSVLPTHVFEREYALCASARHWWHPIAPTCRIEVAFDEPALRWQGRAYLDGNRGDEPLENAFSGWYWQRVAAPESTWVAYVTRPSQGAAVELGMMFSRDGQAQPIPLPPETMLRRSGWGLPQTARADADTGCRQRRWLEDTPFYSRCELDLHWNGHPVRAIHESLSLQRFSRPMVQAMLPFRAPRDFTRVTGGARPST